MTRKTDWRAVRERAMARHLEAFRGDDMDRFLYSLQVMTRGRDLAGSRVMVGKFLRRHRAVVEEILAEP